MTAIAPSASAANFIVDDAGDPALTNLADAQADCGDNDGDCSLREAIYVANDAAGPDTITVEAGLGTIRLQQGYDDGDLDDGDLDITDALTIDGNGVTVTAADLNPGNDPDFASINSSQDRVFDIVEYNTATVTFEDLGITGGFTQPGEHGGGIRSDSCGGLTLELIDVAVFGNLADPGHSSGDYSYGGGLYARGTVVDIEDSTFSGNIAQRGGGIAAEECEGPSPLQLTQSTVVGNSSMLNPHLTEDDGFGTQGAGIWSDVDTYLNLVSVRGNGGDVPPITGPDGQTTFSGYAPWQGGGIFVGDASMYGDVDNLTVMDSQVEGNLAQYAGAGLYLQQVNTFGYPSNGSGFAGSTGSGPLINRVSILDNHTTNTFSQSIPFVGGGGMAVVDSYVVMDNVTIAGNSAYPGPAIMHVTDDGHMETTFDGEGQEPRHSQIDIAHTTVEFNTASLTPGFAADVTIGAIHQQLPQERGVSQEYSAQINFFNSLLQSSNSPVSTCVSTNPSAATFGSVGGNSDDDGTCLTSPAQGDDPENPDGLDTPAANGGPAVGDPDDPVDLKTIALDTSDDAVDAGLSQIDLTNFLGDGSVYCGNPGGLGYNTATDERGVPRPQDGDGDGSAICDRGAYELQGSSTPPGGGGSSAVDVSVDKTGPDEVAVDDQVNFSIMVGNEVNTADNVVVTDTLPSGLEFVSASPLCTEADGTITCNLGSLSSGGSETITITATAVSEGTFTNTACATTSDNDLDDSNDCASHTVTVTGLDPAERVEGPERITTAVAGSQVAFDDGEAGAVVLTRSDDFPDAQAGTPLAIERDAALLLTQPGELSMPTEEEILRVLPPGGTVYLLGGTAALSQAVQDRIVELGYTAVRLGGPNRFGTAALIAEEIGNPDTLLVANGGDFPDSVVAGAASVVAGDSDFAQAGEVGAAVLLTSGETVPPETQAYLDGLGTEPNVIPIGAPAAAAFPEEDDAITGATRYETAVNVAEAFFEDPTAVGVATGENFADALTGGAVVNRPGIGPGPMLLSTSENLPDVVAAYIGDNASISGVLIFGGPAALSPAVEDEINELLGIASE